MNSNYITTTKPHSPQLSDFSRIKCPGMIVLAINFDTLTVTFYFYILFRAFTELGWCKNQEKIVQAKKNVTRFARATVKKSFQMTSGNTSITGLRKAFETLNLDC